MKQIPKIEKYMSPMPHTVGKDIPMNKALDIMRSQRIRHLPVQDGGKLVGVITDRDIKLAASFEGSENTDGNHLVVDDIMTPEPYTVTPQAALDQVVAEMAEHKYGRAIIVQDNGKVVGIFTAVDGLRVLSEVLQQNYRAVG